MGQDTQELRSEIERRRGDIGETLDAIGDRLSPGRMITRRRNRVANRLHTMRDRVMGTVTEGKEMLSDSAGAVSGTVRGAMEDVREAASPDAVRQQVDQQVNGRPLAAGVTAFGLGFLVAAAFPSTRAEAKAAQSIARQAEPITKELAEAGREIVDDVQDEASRASQELKDTAADAARDVARTVSPESSS